MVRPAAIVLAAQLVVIGAAGIAAADVGVVQRNDGTAGTMTHLGDNVGVYSDAHGNTGPVVNPSDPVPSAGGPHGDTATGRITPFGTPAPPSNLTPAPVLPLRPNQPSAPLQPSPPSIAPPGSSSSSGGRFGR